MNKTNLVLIVLALGLGVVCWTVWNDGAASDSSEGEQATASSYRRYVAEVPRIGPIPRFDEIHAVRIVPSRASAELTPEGPASFDREQLGAELGPVLWDLLPPSRRARIHPVGGEPQWETLAAATTLRALFDRCAGLIADPQKRLRKEGGCLWGEVEALAADPSLSETRLVQTAGGVGQRRIPLLYLYGVSTLDQVVNAVNRMQGARRESASAAPVTLAELRAPQAQNILNALVQSVARVEGVVAPWRAPLRKMEELLGGEPRTGFDSFDEESAVAEIEERLDALLALARAEVLDHPNPQELARRQRTVVDSLTALRDQVPAWRARAASFAAQRSALRQSFAALEGPAAENALQTFPPDQPGRLGYTVALERRTRGGLEADTKAFLDGFGALVEELTPYYAELREAFSGLGSSSDEVESMLRTAPRDVVLERDVGGAWHVLTEGGYPAHGERIDGVELKSPRAPGLGPFGALPTLLDIAANQAGNRKLAEGGERPEAGSAPLLMALTDLLAGDPRGAWLPREREYGFDETAIELVLRDKEGKTLDHLRFGAPDAEASNPPPWVEGRRKEELTTRNMAFVHSFNAGRRLAYRVEWMPRVATVGPNQELRRVDFLAGDRRLLGVMNAEQFHRVSVMQGDEWLVISRQDGAGNVGDTVTLGGWDLSSQGSAGLELLGTMDEGLARRFVSQLTGLYFDGIAGRVREGGENWERFGFDEPELVLTARADGFAARLLFGALVRRDGQLYRAVTKLGGAFGETIAGAPYVHLIEEATYERLEESLGEVEEEMRLLSAGPLLGLDFDAIDAIAIREGEADGPAPSLRLERDSEGVWTLPGANGHPADPRRITDPERGLLSRLQGMQRAYPFAGLSDTQQADLERRMSGGTRIEVSAGDGTSAAIWFASDADTTLGGGRLANRRRSGDPLQVVQVEGEDELFLIRSIELPELVLTSWLNLAWQRELDPIKAATSLSASGEALGGASLALKREGEVWTRDEGGGAADPADIEEALSWLENLGALNLSEAIEGPPWLKLNWGDASAERELLLHRVQEGDSTIYVAALPGRTSSAYRVSPLAVDPLVAALKKLAAE